MLSGAGFEDVSSMAGGIKAWTGVVAEGPPQAGMAYFSAADTARDLLALAWSLEEGSRRFYAALGEALEDPEARGFFGRLGASEEHHKAELQGVYQGVPQGGDDIGAAAAALLEGAVGEVMEGGIAVADTLEWAKGRDVAEILELAMGLEANAYDLYIKLGRKMEGTQGRGVLERLLHEEQAHLEMLSELLDRALEPG